MKKLSLIKFCSGLGAVLLLVFWGRIFEVQAQTGALSIGSTTRDVNIIRRLGIGSTSPIALLGISPVTNTEGLRIVASNYSPLVISNSSGADLFRTKEDGNVGIGTSNPQQKLHVVGSILSSSLVNATSSCLYADSNGKISLQGAPCGTGGGGGGLIGSGSTNYLAKWSDPASLTYGVVYDNGNNVGIGTTNPGAKLELLSTIEQLRLSYNGSNYAKFTVDSSGNLIIHPTNGRTYWNTPSINNNLYVYNNSDGDSYTGIGGNAITLKKTGTQTVNIANYGNSYFNSGNVGIGTATPSSKLYLNGGNLTVNNGTVTVTDVKGGHIGGLNLTPTNDDHAVPLRYLKNNYDYWRFATPNKVYVASTTYNVGIGTTAPTEKLTVNGNTYSSGSFLAPNITSFKSNGDLTNTIIGPDGTQIAQSPIAGFIWHDILAFNNLSTPVFETSANGSSWSAGTLDKKLFAQKENQSVVVLDASSLKAVRWTWSSGVSWSLASWMVLGFTWNSPTVNVTVTIDSSSDGTNWTNRHTSNIASASVYPYWLYISPFNGDTYLRLTMTSNSSSGLVSLSTMRLLTSRWGNQGAGSELSYPYTWDENKNIFLPANVGIGTTNPAAKLHIDGGIRSTSLVNATSSCLYADANGAISLLGAPCGSGGGGVGDNLGNHTASQNVRMNGFWLSNDGGDEGVFVKTDGNVGIGTTNPASKLQIASSTNIEGLRIIASNYSPLIVRNSDNSIDYFRINESGVANFRNGINLYHPGEETNLRAFSVSSDYALSLDDEASFGKVVVGSFNDGNFSNLLVNGRIGVGTTTPITKLHIHDTASGPILTMSGLDTNYRGTTIRNTSNAEQWFTGNNASNNFVVRRSGTTDYLTISNSTGNVGIGITNPTANLTVANSVLVKYGSLDIFSASNDYILLNSGVGVGTVAKPSDLTVMGNIYSSNLGGSGDRCLYVNSLGQISAKTEDCGTGSASGSWDHVATQNITLGNYWLSGDGGNEGVFVKSDGNVGIGTTNPTQKLDVNGNIALSSASAILSFSSSTGVKQITTGGNSNLAIMTGTGKLGVGTTNPQNRLHVYSTVTADGLSIDGTSFPAIVLRTSGTIRGYAPAVSSSNGGFFLNSVSGDMIFRSESSNVLFGRDNGSGTANSALSIGLNTGSVPTVVIGNNVGIGITNPAFPLDAYRAAGNTGTSTQISASAPSGASNGIAGYNIKIDSSNLWQLITDNTLSSPMQNAFFVQASGDKTNGRYLTILTNGNVGIGTTSPRYKLAVAGDVGATSFQYSSDLRLKTNIRTIANPLEKIMQLRGVSFNWRADDNPSLGLIAQEVEKVFPEIVSGEEFKSVGYGNLVAPLIEAVKEQQRIIDRLEARINILEIKNRR